MASDDHSRDKTFSILLLGPAGVGKSTLCNTLLLRPHFATAYSAASITASVSFALAPALKQDQPTITLIDCPGFTGDDDDDYNMVSQVQEIKRVDVLLICFDIAADGGRYMPMKHTVLLKKVIQAVGEQMVQERALIVLTKANCLPYEDLPGDVHNFVVRNFREVHKKHCQRLNEHLRFLAEMEFVVAGRAEFGANGMPNISDVNGSTEWLSELRRAIARKGGDYALFDAVRSQAFSHPWTSPEVLEKIPTPTSLGERITATFKRLLFSWTGGGEPSSSPQMQDKTEGQDEKRTSTESTKVVPSSILARGPRATSIFRSLLKKGTTHVRDIRVYLCGEEGVGKSSLRKTILGEDFNTNETSTVGIAATSSKCTFEVHQRTVRWQSQGSILQQSSELTEDMGLVAEMMKKIREEVEHKARENPVKATTKLKEQSVQPLSSKSTALLPLEPCIQEAFSRQPKTRLEEEVLEDSCKADIDRPVAGKSVGELQPPNGASNPADLVARTVDEVNTEFHDIPDDLASLIAQLLKDPSIMDQVEKMIRVSIWDFAGQSMYYAIHHIFMTYVRSIYLLTFRSDVDLKEEAAPLLSGTFKGKSSEHGISARYEHMTHLDYIRQWLAAVHFTARSPLSSDFSHLATQPVCHSNSHNATQSKDVGFHGDTSVSPHVVFVGTFADQLNESLTEKDSALWEVLPRELGFLDEKNPHPAFHHVSRPSGRHVHLIDNTRSRHGSPPTEEVCCLQNHIAQLARRSLDQSVPIPRSWVCFERVLQKLAAKECHMLSVAKIRRILASVCDINEDEEVHLLLQFLSDKGEIVLLNPVQPLQPDGRCVVSIQWLIDRISEVIMVRQRHDRRVLSRHYGEWVNLEDNGILSGKLIEHFWKDARLTKSDQELLVDFMAGRDLVCEITGKGEPGTTELSQREFIVLSLISKVGDVDKFIKEPLDKSPGISVFSMHEVPLFLVAESGSCTYPIPHSMYFRMVVRCLHRWPESPKLQHNCARLHITEYRWETDVVLCHEPVRGTMKIVVQRFVPASPASEDGEGEDEAKMTMSKVCCDVRCFLLKELGDLQETYFAGLIIGTAIACPNAHGVCMRHSIENCRCDTCLQLLPAQGQGLHPGRVLCDAERQYVSLPDDALCWTSEKAQFDRKATKLHHKRSSKTQKGGKESTLNSSTKAARGKELKPGMKLFRAISRRFLNIEDVHRLADDLLDGIEPQGGTAWVKAKTAPGGVPVPQEIVWSVIDYWYNHSRDMPYGGKLYAVLDQVAPRVAEDFKTDLLAEE